MRGRAPSREPARPLKLPQPGPLLNIVGRTSDWFVLEGSEADPHSAPMAQLSTRQPASLTYAPLYLSVPWKGVARGKPGLRNSDGFPLALPKDYSPSGSILSVGTVPFLSCS